MNKEEISKFEDSLLETLNAIEEAKQLTALQNQYQSE